MEKKKRKSNKELLKESDEKVLQAIKEFIEKNSCYTLRSYRNLKFITFPTIKARFGFKIWEELIISLNLEDEYKKALKREKKEKEEAKFKKNIVTESNEELLEKYKKFSESIGAVNGASLSQLKKYNFEYSNTVYTRRFGTWQNLKKLCGYEQKLGSFYTKEEIVKSLLAAREKVGRRLSQSEINKDSTLPVLDTILKYFKTTKLSEVWDELEKGKEKTSTEKIYSIDEIKEILLGEYNKIGRPLKVAEIKENKNIPGISTIYRKFKTTKITEVWKIVLGE